MSSESKLRRSHPTRAKPNVYPPVGRCIYCESETTDLTKEHVTPLGLDGGFILRRASCGDCAKITGAVESWCQNEMLGAYRKRIGLSSNRKSHKGQFGGARARTDGKGGTIFAIDSSPPLLILPKFHEPVFISTHKVVPSPLLVKENIVVYSEARHVRLGAIPERKIPKSSPYDPIRFGRMLAKIGHALAVAELDWHNFAPFLKPIILGSDLSFIGSVVGGWPSIMPSLPMEASLNSAGIYLLPDLPHSYVPRWILARIVLFRSINPIAYCLVVGELTPTPGILEWPGFKRLTAAEKEAFRRRYGL